MKHGPWTQRDTSARHPLTFQSLPRFAIAFLLTAIATLPAIEAQLVVTDRSWIPGNEINDRNGDGFDDLAVGVPDDTLTIDGGVENAGRVRIHFGSRDGIPSGSPGNQSFIELALIGGVSEAGDRVLGVVNAGNVAVLRGGSGALQSTGAQLWNGLFLLTLEPGDELGFSLATGRFSGRGGSDLAIGVPGRETESGLARAGGVLILRNQSLFADGFESGTLNSWSSVPP